MPPGDRRVPQLPALLARKIYKTGQTRGADDDEIYQNRVGRNSTVLIPYPVWDLAKKPPEPEKAFEFGSIALISPTTYFGLKNPEQELAKQGLVLGTNALVFYETREQWLANDPAKLKWVSASSRLAPLKGQYVARISATTAQDGQRIVRGFDTTANKGAGIRVYEYASMKTIKLCRAQLEALFWLCDDAKDAAAKNGMSARDIEARRAVALEGAKKLELLDFDRLRTARIVNRRGHTVCPLCLEELSAHGFFARMAQAEGRETLDLTVTQLNLFHIGELRFGFYEHRPYNLGWGHHHCNVVVRDAGIGPTLKWMQDVIDRNRAV
jgi:hypothetical protein